MPGMINIGERYKDISTAGIINSAGTAQRHMDDLKSLNDLKKEQDVNTVAKLPAGIIATAMMVNKII